MSMTVNEIFYSLQGEGGRVGQASIFIRLSKCNLACSFCDTEFESGTKMTLDEILAQIKQYPGRWIIWTGGEPALQLNEQTVEFFHQNGYKQAIETNGTRPIPATIDYIVCSPKQNFERIKTLIPHAHELRFPIAAGDPLPDIAILPKADRYMLSPIFDNNNMVNENVAYCVELIKKNPIWTLSLQTHKLIGIR